MRFWTIGLLSLGVAISPAVAQVVLTNLARDFEAAAATEDVRCTLFASFEETGVEVGMMLEPGDLLASVSGETDLELTCPGGSLLRFSGNFRVLINPPAKGADCAVNFLSGTLDVLTDQPTEVNAGGVVLGTEGTQYSVELVRGQEGVEEKCSVWDGRVRWRARAGPDQFLDGGKRLDWSRDRVAEVQIADAELSRVALRQARFDALKSVRLGGTVDPRAAAEHLSGLIYQVLARPDDRERRVELARAQIDYQMSGQASYQLERAGIRSDEQMRSYRIDVDKLKAGLAATGSVAPERLEPRPASDPFALIELERYREALQILEPRAAAGDADSRDYCGIARSYFYLEGANSRQAAGYAHKALAANARDRKTPAEELRLCGHLVR